MEEVLGHFVESEFGLTGLATFLAFGIAFYFYEGDLAKAGPDRERLRSALEEGGDLRLLYVRLLTHALNWLDRFLGDAGKPELSWPSPFGNRQRYPYWTGRSFDRCAVLALIYPLASLFLVWVWTGKAGAVGTVLGMAEDAEPWRRALAAACVAAALDMARRAFRKSRGPVRPWFLVAAAVSGGAAAVVAVAGVGGAAVAFAVGAAGAGVSTSLPLSLSPAWSPSLATPVAVPSPLSVSLSMSLYSISRFRQSCASNSAGSGVGSGRPPVPAHLWVLRATPGQAPAAMGWA
jgi:hypothetical protein